MRKPQTWTEHIYTILICILYSNSLLLTIIASTTVTIPLYQTMLLGTVCLLGLYAILYNRTVGRIFGILLLAALLVFIVIRFLQYGGQQIMDTMLDFFYYVWGLLSSAITLPKQGEIVVVILLSLFISYYTLFFYLRLLSFYVLFINGFLIFLGQLLTGNFAYTGNQVAFYIFIVAVAIMSFKRVSYNLYKKGDERFEKKVSSFCMTTIPVVLVVILISSVLPNFAKPLSGLELGYYYSGSYYKSGVGEFSLASTGFGDSDTQLGGNVQLNHSLALEVTADKPQYLTGHIKNIYTGNSWKVDDDDKKAYQPGNNLELIEPLIALKGTQSQYQTDIMVRYHSVNTRSIFQAGLLQSLTFPNNQKVWINSNHELYSNQYLGNDTHYMMRSLVVDETDLLGSLKQSRLGYYTVPDYEGDAGFRVSGSVQTEDTFSYTSDGQDHTVSKDELIQNALEIEAQYLQLPDSLPGRVWELAMTITQDYTMNYNKVKAIETYLTQFPYTLTPGTTPEGRDFVDYFLFDLGKGYCTYYASAMAVLTRCIGLPSRYVEGFAPVYTKTNGKYYVENSKAHAWVEVYFTGVGWVRFEPTTPYNYQNSGEEVPAETFDASLLEDPNYKQYVDSFKQESEEDVSPSVTTSRPSSTGTSSQAPAPIPEAESKMPTGRIVLLLAGSLLLLGLLLLILRIAQRKCRLAGIAKRSRTEQVGAYFAEICKLLRAVHLPMLAHESIQEYLLRLQHTPYMRDLSVPEASEIFERTAYSDVACTQEESALVRHTFLTVEKRVQNKIGKIKFFWKRSIIHKI